MALGSADGTLESSKVWGSIALAPASRRLGNEFWELSNPLCLANMPKNGMLFPKDSSRIQNFLVWIGHD